MSPKNTSKRHGRVPKRTADPSPSGSSRQHDQSSKRVQDDGESMPWLAQERNIGYRETRSSRTNGGTQARHCRSPNRADKSFDAQVKLAQEAPSRVPKYENIITAIEVLDDVVQMYEDTADTYRQTQAWNKYGKTLYKNILCALHDLVSLSTELPSPGRMLAEVKVAENLSTALQTIDPEGFLKSMRHVAIGVEGGNVMRLRMRLNLWLKDGQKETEQFLQIFKERCPPNKQMVQAAASHI